MAFVDREPPRARPGIIITVAAIHAAAIYALVTGLAQKYIDIVVEVPLGYNIPEEKTQPPPPPDDAAKPDPIDRPVTVVDPIIKIPQPDNAIVVPQIPDVLLPPIPEPRDLLPAPVPPAPVPSFTPLKPTPRTNPGNWVTTNDYPTPDIRAGNEGTARFMLTIGTNGKVTDCRITSTTGHSGLDRATCKNVSSRARFKPAKNDRGHVVTGSYAGSIRWVIPD